MTEEMPITERLDAILELQIDEAMLLLGVYLSPPDMSEVKPYLDRDGPATGGIGRFKGISVYHLAEYRVEVGESGGEHKGIVYKCVHARFVN